MSEDPNRKRQDLKAGIRETFQKNPCSAALTLLTVLKSDLTTTRTTSDS